MSDVYYASSKRSSVHVGGMSMDSDSIKFMHHLGSSTFQRHINLILWLDSRVSHELVLP